jgi:two-component system, response regulator YesN
MKGEEADLSERPERPLQAPQGAQAMRPGPILVVEDDRAVQELIALALSDAYDVKHAATASEALTVLEREAVAAVVLDYRLPDRTGLELLNDIRSAQPSLPVIMMTGYGSEWVCTSAFKLGVRDYLQKPVNLFELLHSVGLAVSTPSESPASGDAGAGGGQLSTSSEPIPRLADAPIQKVVLLIQRRYWDRLSLTQLAREAGMSKYRLSHRFSEVMGVPFREYLLRVRLERAKDLLAAGHTSITEVAQAVGFGDLPRFDKLFRRNTGLTPSAYRSQNCSGSDR